MLFGKAFQDDDQREISCVKHALSASGTPYSEKTKKQTANEFLKNRHIPFHIKLSLLSFYYIPPLYSGFMKLCETKARKNIHKYDRLYPRK